MAAQNVQKCVGRFEQVNSENAYSRQEIMIEGVENAKIIF